MKLEVNELEENGYVLKEKFTFNELTGFVKEYLAKTNVATVFFLIINIVFFALLALRVALAAVTKMNGSAYVTAFSSGILLLIVLIPIHEAIHYLAYRYCGARKVSFTINLKSLAVLTLADKFVADRTEFTAIALAPFTAISIALIGAYFFTGPYVQCAITSALVMHTFMCAGDFGLASYFLFHNKEVLVTYDDAEEQASYFYQKVK